MPIKSLSKEIVFDGSRFWLENEEIGEIEETFKFQSPIDKKMLDEKKAICLGRIINCEGDTK